MPEQRLQQVLEILSRYNNQGIVDYYEIFGLTQNMTNEEIKAQIKKNRLQVLFHPDQINFVPKEYHKKYLEMIEVVKDAINTFDNEKNRNQYDTRLESEKRNEAENKKASYSNQGSNNQTSNFNQDNYWENKNENMEETILQQAIIITANKHGFEFAKDALVNYFNTGTINGFTRDQNARGMMAELNRGSLMRRITLSSLFDNPENIEGNEQIIMNYMTDFIYNNQSLRQQINSLEHACNTTIAKYDLKGYYGQTGTAIYNFYTTGDAKGFTSDKNGRDNLVNNANPRDVKFFMQCALNKRRHENQYYAYQNTKNWGIKDIIDVYSGELINSMRNQYTGGQYDDGYNR